MRVLISDTHKYIYHMNPKVASNTTLTVLYHLAGMAKENIGNPHQVSRDAALLKRYNLKAVDGLVYTAGIIVYSRDNWRFNRAIWHGFVLFAAAIHYVAILNIASIA